MTTISSRQLGDGPPLLLLNGYAASTLDWDPRFLDALAGASTVICPENRGMADSISIDGTLTIGQMADDVLALIDHEEITTVDVAGWSMGGFVAQEVASRASERVGRLALLSTDGGGPGAVRADDAIWADLIDYSGSPREQATRLLGLIFPRAVAKDIDRQFGDLVADARAALRPETLDAQANAIDLWHSEPVGGRLDRIAAPTLVAAGREDVVIPFANAELLAETLSASRLEAFEGCGHAFTAQEPGRLGGMINDWLGRPDV